MGEYTSSVMRLSFGFFFLFMAFNTTQVRREMPRKKSMALKALTPPFPKRPKHRPSSPPF
jgi:hypothetical protein